MYQRQSEYALAETHAAPALAGRRHALGSEHPDTMASAADLALAYVSQGKFAQSEPLTREALEFDARSSWRTGNDSAPKACWAPAWLGRRNMPKPNRCCSKVIGE